MAETRKGPGKVGWIILILVALAAAIFGLWQWALNAQSVATLDRADALFTGRNAVVSEPISFGADPNQTVTVIRPATAGAGALPVIVFIHGGSWAKGNPVDYAYVGRNLAPAGLVTVSAGYRLVPGGEYPAMLEDGAASVRWVVDNIATFGGDPDRIYLMGHSAGAYNAVMLGLDRQWLSREGLADDAIDGVIGLAGPYDFLPLDSEGTIGAFGDAGDLEKTQPVNFVRADAPPLLLMTGDADTTVRPRNSKLLAELLTGLGQPTEPVLFPEMGHAGIIMALSRPFDGGGAVKQTIIDWIAAREARVLLRRERASAAVQPGGA